MLIPWPSLNQISIVLELFSFILVTPVLLGENRLGALKEYFDKKFEYLKALKEKDLTYYLIHGKIGKIIKAIILGLWVFLMAVIFHFVNIYVQIGILVINGLIPIVLITFSLFLPNEKKESFGLLAEKIVMYPTTFIFLRIIKPLTYRLEIITDFVLNWVLKVFYPEGGSPNEYQLVVFGFILFIASKILAFIDVS